MSYWPDTLEDLNIIRSAFFGMSLDSACGWVVNLNEDTEGNALKAAIAIAMTKYTDTKYIRLLSVQQMDVLSKNNMREMQEVILINTVNIWRKEYGDKGYVWLKY